MTRVNRNSSGARKTATAIVGGIVLLAGLIMLVTPGPGWLGIAAGLAILATEFEWAERQLQRVRDRLRAVGRKVRTPTDPPRGQN